jgi:hypothetical protein
MTRKSEQLIGQLLEHAVEMHSKEMKDYHGGDVKYPGLAPEACSYCKTFDAEADLLGIDLTASVEASTGGD